MSREVIYMQYPGHVVGKEKKKKLASAHLCPLSCKLQRVLENTEAASVV